MVTKKKAAKKTTKKKTAKKKAIKKAKGTPLLPLRDVVVFPHMSVPFFVGREKSILAIEEAVHEGGDIFLCAQKNRDIDEPLTVDLYKEGTLASIVQLLKLADGTLKVLVEGHTRAKVSSFLKNDDFFEVDLLIHEASSEVSTQSEALSRSLIESFEKYVQLNKRIAPEIFLTVSGIENPNRLADNIVAHMNLKLLEKQNLLATFDVEERMEKLLSLIKKEIEILEVEKKIRDRVKKQMEQGQKEYYLNEQMNAIQKELGDRDEFQAELQELEERIEKTPLSDEALTKAASEMKKLKMMNPVSAEANVSRIYLDWLLSLPWGKRGTDNFDLESAEATLNKDHFGLKKVKEHLLDNLAVQVLNPKRRAPILCLIGPPGVGKTSLGASIAKALNKKFTRISLGGLRDEAEIRGHRKTYIGALPGKIIQAMKKVDTMNPVILLDEIDKIGSDYRGDPSSAMLEVLDPEQNASFSDHYLEVDFDLSGVTFIATANNYDGIPGPLMDRMEMIDLSSYTENEKLHIAQEHLIPKQAKEHGLDDFTVDFKKEALVEVIRHYTHEAGVRNLQRVIAKVLRKSIRKILETKSKSKKLPVDVALIHDFLGPRQFKFGTIEAEHNIGMTQGLAWTSTGGDILNIECRVLPGSGKMQITGKLGEVMQESAQAAFSYVRSIAHFISLPKDFYKNVDIHIHVPEGSIPKDGPSAGVAMVTSLVSALSLKAVLKDCAMTGEITLRGKVLPIGGLKEKLLAARRSGIKKVIIPFDNKKDLHELSEEVLNNLEIIPVKHLSEVLENALEFSTNDPLFDNIKNKIQQKTGGLQYFSH